MKITLYLSGNKERELAIGRALQAGFERHGDQVTVRWTAEYTAPDEGSQLAAVIGVKGNSKKIFEEYRRAGRHTLLVDKAYFERARHLRLVLDGFQPHYAHAIERPHDRLERFGLDLKPRRKGRGDYVIYAGSSQKYCDWHDLGDATAFAETTCKRINKVFGTGNELPSIMPLLYRPKPSWVAGHPDEARPVPATIFSGPDVKLPALLPRCHALVTHGSNAAVEAVIAGIPAVVVSRGACAAEPVAELDLEKGLWDPRFPGKDERRQWLANLAYCQFPIEEISNGYAWSTLQPMTIKPLEQKLAGLNELDAVAELYRLMHQSPKMFRGRLADVYGAEIAELCLRHSATSLLDYGSGKGHQYSVHRQHETWGFPEPVCYDIGVEAFRQKPKGPFDGVLCLDMLEHVPEAFVDHELDEIFRLARKFVYLVIFTAPARKSLPDGRNAHLTVKPEAWWDQRIQRAARGQEIRVHYKGEDA